MKINNQRWNEKGFIYKSIFSYACSCLSSYLNLFLSLKKFSLAKLLLSFFLVLSLISKAFGLSPGIQAKERMQIKGKDSNDFLKKDSPRIQELFLNRSSPQRIYLIPGLTSSIKMPCEIDEVVTPSAGVQKQLSEKNKTRFSIEVSDKARSTNFIVHCLSVTYVFDLIVNEKLHNDYIEVVGDYGKPRLTQRPSGFLNLSQEGSKEKLSSLKAPDKIKAFKSNGERVFLDLTPFDEQNQEKTSQSTDYKKIKKVKIYSTKSGVL